jgi:hypothetical protein
VLFSVPSGSGALKFSKDAACCVFARVFRGDIRAALLWELCGRRRIAYLSSPMQWKNPGQVNPFSPEISGQTCPSFSPAKESSKRAPGARAKDEAAILLGFVDYKRWAQNASITLPQFSAVGNQNLAGRTRDGINSKGAGPRRTPRTEDRRAPPRGFLYERPTLIESR